MWSYKIIKNYYTTDEELDMYGSEGWELVCVRGQRHYFKKWVEPEYWLTTSVKNPETIKENATPVGPVAVEETVIVLHTEHTGHTGYTGPVPPMSDENHA